ncbi:MAG: preprotein translocase subunit SecF [Thermotogota bacterium]|nr:preprotein translocase subunit SecF [Thermotogota bacterium]MDK2863813.1 preprotein translocase subunit SecF [Thermotogota bacterium]
MREIDFVGKRRIFISISIALMIFSLVVIFAKGFRLGVDFSGGTELTVIVKAENVEVADLRKALAEYDPAFEAALISRQQSVGEDTNISKFSVVISTFFTDPDVKQALVSHLNEWFKNAKNADIEVSFTAVSGAAALEIRSGTWWAVVLAVVLILGYVTLRFRFVFGVGAIVALVHDLLITMGFYSLFGIELGVPAVAAFLTLLGYSLNDTIVVYDKIRENMRRMRGNSPEKIVNMSINQVIVRSLNTSITTFIVVLALLLFSGKVLQSFAFGLVVGVVVGTYSSLYIASPIVIGWLKRGWR